MLAIASLLVILALSLLITRVATSALSHTGLSKESARFQARSAFTGVGFTTNESESVVNHPLRRRILMTLMLLGNAGIVTSVSSLMLGLIKPQGDGLVVRLLVLFAGIVALMIIARSKWIDKHLSRVIDAALKRYSKMDIKDYASILHLASGYTISELKIEKKDWLANRTLAESQMKDEGVNVLGIQRKNGPYIGTLEADTLIKPDDTLILYGRQGLLKNLDRRGKGIHGDIEHNKAVADQKAEAEKARSADETNLHKKSDDESAKQQI
ncbi:MAG: potassium transporter TrkA [Chitinivibrionales bacterium]|nr:potassium transporter TrkA [Chitinivibrionales bacterium]